MNYQPNFDGDNIRGQVGEESFKEFLEGTYEVKTDYRTVETGNLFVETWQKPHNKDWKQSGINVTKADFWVQASPLGLGGIYIDTLSFKELLSEKNPRETYQPISSPETSASKGRLLELAHLLQKLGFSQ